MGHTPTEHDDRVREAKRIKRELDIEHRDLQQRRRAASAQLDEAVLAQRAERQRIREEERQRRRRGDSGDEAKPVTVTAEPAEVKADSDG